MTFSILGHCAKTGKTGFAQATGSPSVGWRTARVVRGRGVITIQSFSDLRQLNFAIRLMEAGATPQKVMKDLRDNDEYFEYRQIAILDHYGRSAVNSGTKNINWAGAVVEPDHVATGNVLVGEQVVQSMSKAFKAAADEPFEERLMRALEAGRDAGGQPDGQTSSTIVVYESHEFPLVDLRIDVSMEPVAELRKIFDWYKPLMRFYYDRTMNPGSVVRYKRFLKENDRPLNPYGEPILE